MNETNEYGDVIVPDEPDHLGYQKEKFDDMPHFPLVKGGPAEAARNIINRPDRPVAVDVDDRAQALETIMDAFNKESRSMGAAVVRMTGDNRFDSRYGKYADDVREGMKVNVHKANIARDRALDVLLAADNIRYNDQKNGVPQAETEDKLNTMRADLLRDLQRKYGVGSNHKERNKLERKVNKTARILKHGKKR